MIYKFKRMGLLQPFSEPPSSNQNPRGFQQTCKDPWAERDIGKNAPDETQKNGHHTSLCVNNGYLAKDARFWIDFGIRVETHVKIRKWASKVMGFTIFIHFSKQNAQGATEFKTKRMADLRKFVTYVGNFAVHIYRKKSLKTQVRGTS